METVCHIQMRHVVRSLLLGIPADCVRILDFNLKAVDADRMHIIRESLKCCDLLKIDVSEFTEICRLQGLKSQHTFDEGFEMMSLFGIKTLILTHGTRGCHVFHGRAVSEKWGMAGLGDHQSEEAEAAFLASYYAASRRPGILFTECHRIAFGYMRQVYEND